jgi:hypothetical protein
MSARTRTLAVAGLAALALAAPAANAGPLAPSPLTDLLPFPALGSYNGGIFPSEALLALPLSCNVLERTLSCFDTPLQAKTAGPAPRLGQRCHPALRVWRETGRPGRNALAFYDSGYWLTLPKSWRNQISSYAAGCDLTARFSDLPAGGGAQIKRPPRSGDDAMPAGWDDRVDAVYRG